MITIKVRTVVTFGGTVGVCVQDRTHGEASGMTGKVLFAHHGGPHLCFIGFSTSIYFLKVKKQNKTKNLKTKSIDNLQIKILKYFDYMVLEWR